VNGRVFESRDGGNELGLLCYDSAGPLVRAQNSYTLSELDQKFVNKGTATVVAPNHTLLT